MSSTTAATGDETARPPAINTRRPGRCFGANPALVALAALATIGLLVAGCGGGSNQPRVASVSGTRTTVAPSRSPGSASSGEFTASAQLQFAQCMRSHGVHDFPDPSAGGGFLNAISRAGPNSDLKPTNPTYHAAERACARYTPEGRMTPAQRAEENATGLQLSQCMRSHGVFNFPDPITGPAGEQAINLSPERIDPNSPTFQAANAACQKIVPGGK